MIILRANMNYGYERGVIFLPVNACLTEHQSVIYMYVKATCLSTVFDIMQPRGVHKHTPAGMTKGNLTI